MVDLQDTRVESVVGTAALAKRPKIQQQGFMVGSRMGQPLDLATHRRLQGKCGCFPLVCALRGPLKQPDFPKGKQLLTLALPLPPLDS